MTSVTMQQTVWAAFKVFLVLGAAIGLSVLHAFTEPYESAAAHTVFTVAKFGMVIAAVFYAIATVQDMDRKISAAAAAHKEKSRRKSK